MVIFRFFQHGDRLPSWICGAHVGTTHLEYLQVFIIYQNLVGIYSVAFTARRYASQYRHAFVSLSVCHTPVLY